MQTHSTRFVTPLDTTDPGAPRQENRRASCVRVLRFTALLLAAVIVGRPTWLFADGARPRTFLLVWSSDKGTDDHQQDADFVAVIDADSQSPTYGKIVNTAAIEAAPGKHLLAKLGLAPGLPSNLLNEAHHMNTTPLIGPNGHKYLFPGGLISANIFKCDVTDPLHIPPCALAVDSTEVNATSGTDDIKVLPNGNLIATYMGFQNGPLPTLLPTLTSPGGLVEFTPDGTVVAEYAAAKAGGPTRYRPSVHGETDTGLLAHPHGIDLRPDLDVLITSDYACPFSLATSTSTDQQHQDLGTTVRIWKLSNLGAGPQKIVQVPDGPRREGNPLQPGVSESIHEEPEGLMAVSLLHKPTHKGAFVASMSGGVLFYAPDVTVPHPVFTEVYDFGPSTGASVFTIDRDDRYLILSVAGMRSPGDPKFNRDYPGEHSRRVVVLDIRRLLAAGTTLQCGPPQVRNGSDGFTTKLLGRNNRASDCPVEVGKVVVDSQKNYETHGGPHFVVLEKGDQRIAFSNYFVDLQAFGLPGTGSGGDDKVCIAKLGGSGKLTLDTQFRDELTGAPCVDFDRPTSYAWPRRGQTGNAKPHALAFIHTAGDD